MRHVHVDHVVLRLRARDVELVGVHDVHYAPEELHHFRDVHERGNLVSLLHGLAVKGELAFARDAPERAHKIVEVRKSLLRELVGREIFQNHVRLHHGRVRQRSASSEHHATVAAVQRLDVLRLHLHIDRPLAVALRETSRASLACRDRQALEVVRLVHEKLVHAKLLKRHDLAVVVLGVRKMVDLLGQLVEHLVRLVHGNLVAGLAHRLDDLLHVLALRLKEILLVRLRHAELLRERGMLHHDRVPVPVRHLREERAPVPGLHVVFRHLEDVRVRESLHELVGELLQHVVRDYVHRLLEHAEVPSENPDGLHFKRLACAHAMREAQGAAAKNAARNDGGLVFASLLRRVRVSALEELAKCRFAHPGRAERKHVVRQLDLHHVCHDGVVPLIARLGPLFARHDELRERLVHLLGGKLVRFCPALVKVLLLVYRVGDEMVHRTVVQHALDEIVHAPRRFTPRTLVKQSSSVITDVPLAGHFIAAELHARILCPQGVVHEIGHALRVNPRRAELDFSILELHHRRLRLLQRLHVRAVGFLARLHRRPCGRKLCADAPGKVFPRRFKASRLRVLESVSALFQPRDGRFLVHSKKFGYARHVDRAGFGIGDNERVFRRFGLGRPLSARNHPLGEDV